MQDELAMRRSAGNEGVPGRGAASAEVLSWERGVYVPGAGARALWLESGRHEGGCEGGRSGPGRAWTSE